MCSNTWSRVRDNGQYNGEFGVRVCVIRAFSLSHCCSSWCWRRFCASFALVCHGSSSTLTTWCLLRICWRSVYPSPTSERLAWKVKRSMSTRRKPTSRSAVLALMSPRRMASILVLSVAVQLNSIGCSRIAQGCSGITGRLRADASYAYPRCKVRPVDGKLVTKVDNDDTVFDLEVGFCNWPVEHSRNSYLFPPLGTSCFRCAARITWHVFFRLCSTVAKREDRPPQICFRSAVPPPQWSVHDPLDLWYQRPRQTPSASMLHTQIQKMC